MAAMPPACGRDFSHGGVGGRRRPSIVDPCVLKEEVMQSVKLELLSSRARVACAAFALVFGLASVSFVVVLFDSASKESERPLQR
jgi:hypothetical protein